MVIKERGEPTLIGDKTLEIDKSVYYDKVFRLKPHASSRNNLRRTRSHIAGQFIHLLIDDLISRSGWLILPYSLGWGTQPLALEDPIAFIERNTGLKLSNEIKEY